MTTSILIHLQRNSRLHIPWHRCFPRPDPSICYGTGNKLNPYLQRVVTLFRDLGLPWECALGLKYQVLLPGAVFRSHFSKNTSPSCGFLWVAGSGGRRSCAVSWVGHGWPHCPRYFWEWLVFISRQQNMLSTYKVHPPLSTESLVMIRHMENKIAIVSRKQKRGRRSRKQKG